MNPRRATALGDSRPSGCSSAAPIGVSDERGHRPESASREASDRAFEHPLQLRPERRPVFRGVDQESRTAPSIWCSDTSIGTGSRSSRFRPEPDNTVELGGPDSGQPTYFLPRRQRFVFRVRVPKDFGKKEVVWSITANGRTELAYGSLLTATGDHRACGDDQRRLRSRPDRSEQAAITHRRAHSEAPVAGSPVALSATVADDGLPKPRVTSAPQSSTTSSFGGQVNSSGSAPRPAGLTVSWMQYGGPAKVTFETAGPIPVTNGQAVMTARFDNPGRISLSPRPAIAR